MMVSVALVSSRSFSHIAVFFLLVLASLVPSSDAAASCLKFRQAVISAPWSTRWSTNADVYPNSLPYRTPTGSPATLPAGSMVLYGGSSAYRKPSGNDVWVSTDGAKWVLIAGETEDGDSAYQTAAGTSFEARGNSAHASTVTGRQYIVGGFDVNGDRTADVFWSDNLLKWTMATQTANWFTPRADAACVAPPLDYNGDKSSHQLVCVGGWLEDGDEDGGVSSQVWVGTNNGARWRQVKDGPFPARRSFPMVTYYSEALKSNVITFMTGVSRSGPYLSDVWTSLDNGITFVQITDKGPFGARNDATAEVTSEGIMTLVAGSTQVDGQLVRQNDVWVSVDGGYTWTELVTDAPWDDRWRQSSLFDNQNRLIVVAGANGDNEERYNDVWSSTITMDSASIRSIADACKITLPACGRFGMQCMPMADDTRAIINYKTGALSISCNACPAAGTSTSSSTSTVIIAVVVVFVILFVVTLLALAYVLNVMKSSGAAPPLPLLKMCWGGGGGAGHGMASGHTDLLGTDGGGNPDYHTLHVPQK